MHWFIQHTPHEEVVVTLMANIENKGATRKENLFFTRSSLSTYFTKQSNLVYSIVFVYTVNLRIEVDHLVNQKQVEN